MNLWDSGRVRAVLGKIHVPVVERTAGVLHSGSDFEITEVK